MRKTPFFEAFDYVPPLTHGAVERKRVELSDDKKFSARLRHDDLNSFVNDWRRSVRAGNSSSPVLDQNNEAEFADLGDLAQARSQAKKVDSLAKSVFQKQVGTHGQSLDLPRKDPQFSNARLNKEFEFFSKSQYLQSRSGVFIFKDAQGESCLFNLVDFDLEFIKDGAVYIANEGEKAFFMKSVKEILRFDIVEQAISGSKNTSEEISCDAILHSMSALHPDFRQEFLLEDFVNPDKENGDFRNINLIEFFVLYRENLSANVAMSFVKCGLDFKKIIEAIDKIATFCRGSDLADLQKFKGDLWIEFGEKRFKEVQRDEKNPQEAQNYEGGNLNPALSVSVRECVDRVSDGKKEEEQVRK